MHVFINGKINANGNWEPADRFEFESVIRELLNSIKCIEFFTGSKLYYNSEELRNLFEDLDLMDGVEKFGLFDEIKQLREYIKQSGAIDCAENQLHKSNYSYLVQLGDGFCPYPTKDSSLAEACEFKHQGYKTLVLNFSSSSEFNTYNLIKIIRADLSPPKDMDLVKVESVHDKKNLVKYYLKNREVEYNHNFKHPENSTEVTNQNGEIISPLECSVIQAAELLKVSVGHKSVKELFSFDSNRNKFIEFKPESNSNNKYHGYHPSNQKIPTKIEYFLKDNFSLFDKILKEL